MCWNYIECNEMINFSVMLDVSPKFLIHWNKSYEWINNVFFHISALFFFFNEIADSHNDFLTDKCMKCVNCITIASAYRWYIRQSVKMFIANIELYLKPFICLIACYKVPRLLLCKTSCVISWKALVVKKKMFTMCVWYRSVSQIRHHQMQIHFSWK